MKIRLKVETLYDFESSYRYGLLQGGKYCSLKYVLQQIEIRNAQKTLRSAERAPTLSAGYKISLALLLMERGFSFYSFFVV